MASARRAALKPLHFLESRDPALQKEGALRVLEIGAGSGANFEHITRKIRYTNVDPNPEFCNVFFRELKRYPKVLRTCFSSDLDLWFFPRHHSCWRYISAMFFLSLLCWFERAVPTGRRIELERLVECHGENMNELEDEQFDVVLFTYLLCSVQDGRKVLEEAKRVLVKGGQLIFLEHVAHPKWTWPRLLQSLITPLWKITLLHDDEE
ncbi:thiol S-methyltransferase TMT1B-like [Dermacentor albipictus]|uniref:thiol S-methyltransferase TMT1B-like n=1 Tax=Dermacentor albipictus TaxID=60249 RepID=UPI0038FBFAA4